MSLDAPVTWLVCGVLLVATVAAGLAVSERPRAALVPVPLLLLGWLSVRLPAWDLLFFSGMYLLGMLSGRRSDGGRLWGGVVVFLLAATVAGEVAIRKRTNFVLEAQWTPWLPQPLTLYRESLCTDIYDTPTESGSWLHLGDSMLVFSNGEIVSERTSPTRFVSHLQRSDPSHVHLNLGVPGTSQDAALLLARAHARSGPVDHLVLYHLPVNDLTDLDQVYACCLGGPLLDYSDAALPARCERPPDWFREPRSTQRWLAASPSPLPILLFSRHTTVGAELRARLMPLLLPQPGGVSDARLIDRPEDAERLWQRFDAILDRFEIEFAARGTTIHLVLLPAGLPDHRSHRTSAYRREREDRTLALCASHGFDCIDARPAVDGTPPEGGWHMPDGVHFNDAGHAHIAAWLRPRLGL